MIKVKSSENFSFQSYQNKNKNKGWIPWTKTQIQLVSDVLLGQTQKPRENDALFWKFFILP